LNDDDLVTGTRFVPSCWVSVRNKAGRGIKWLKPDLRGGKPWKAWRLGAFVCLLVVEPLFGLRSLRMELESWRATRKVTPVSAPSGFGKTIQSSAGADLMHPDLPARSCGCSVSADELAELPRLMFGGDSGNVREWMG
jgi:hypothetical protein